MHFNRLPLVLSFFVALVGISLGFSKRGFAREDEAFSAPSPLIGGGFRFQTVDRGSRPDLFFLGVNVLCFKRETGDQGAFWSFISPGLHYQSSSERRIAVSIAPVTYVGQTGISFAAQLFPFDSGRTGGFFGFSVGYHFF